MGSLSQSGCHVVGDGNEDSDMGILAGKDVLQVLRSNMKKDMRRNPFIWLFSESGAQENTIAAATTTTTSPTTTLHQPPTTSSLRKQRKAYKPSRVPPSEEKASPPTIEKSSITDDHDSVRMVIKASSFITHDGSIMMKNTHEDSMMMMMEKKHDDSTTMMANSVITHDSNIIRDDDPMMMKAMKGKRKKRQDSLCTTTVCKNLSCKALLHPGAPFCRRCSCCICKRFDDNKDPSLWITCNYSEAEEGQEGCGLSCHVECALQEEVAGVIKNGSTLSLDGSYCCQPCGKISSLVGFWKKQLLVAKDARRVDILCRRLFLSHRLLNRTVRYKDAHCFIDEAIKKLEAEVCLMIEGSAKLARCIANRLSCKVEVQKLINLALEKMDTLSLDATSTAHDAKNASMHNKASCAMQFEDVCSSSMVVVPMDNHPNGKLGYKLWHRRTTDPSYLTAPTDIICSASKKALVSDLHPLTVHAFRLVHGGDGGQCEAEYCTKDMEAVVEERPAGENKSDCVLGVSDINGSNRDEPKAVQKHQYHASISNDDASHSIESQYLRKEGTENHGAVEYLTNTKTSSTSEVYEDRENQSMEGPRDVLTGLADTNKRIVSTRKDTCETAQSLRVTHPSSSELEKVNEEVIILNNGGLGDRHPPTMVKALGANIMDSNAPFQSWAMQVHRRESDAAGILSKRTVQGMNGAIDCSSEADFRNFELSVKAIYWLECQGHLKEEFRMKFLTWYSLRAREHEKRMVSVFINTLQDSPASLAGQLVDAFQDIVTSKRQRTTEEGYCSRLC